MGRADLLPVGRADLLLTAGRAGLRLTAGRAGLRLMVDRADLRLMAGRADLRLVVDRVDRPGGQEAQEVHHGAKPWSLWAGARKGSTFHRTARSYGQLHMGDGRISVIDLASKKVIHTIDAEARGPNRLKFTPDGKLALVSELGGGGLIVLDTGSRTVTKRIKLGQGASGILIPPQGLRAYVAMTGDNAIAIIDLKTLDEVGRLKTGRGPDGMAWLDTRP